MRPHRFEPARLVPGVLLIAVAVTYGLDALGTWDVPVRARLAMVPGALFVAVGTALITFLVRRRTRSRRARGAAAPGEDTAAGA